MSDQPDFQQPIPAPNPLQPVNEPPATKAELDKWFDTLFPQRASQPVTEVEPTTPEPQRGTIHEDPFNPGAYATGLGLGVDNLLRFSPEARGLLKQARDQGYSIVWGDGNRTDRLGRRITIDQSFRATPAKAADALGHELGLATKDPEYAAAPTHGNVANAVRRNVGIDLNLQGHAEIERMKIASQVEQNLGKYANVDSAYFRSLAARSRQMGQDPEIAPADTRKLSAFEAVVSEKLTKGKMTEQQAEAAIGSFMANLHPSRASRGGEHAGRHQAGHHAAEHHVHSSHHAGGNQRHHAPLHGERHSQAISHENFWQRLFRSHSGKEHGHGHSEHSHAARQEQEAGVHSHSALHSHRSVTRHGHIGHHAHRHGSLHAAGATYEQIYTREWQGRFAGADQQTNRFGGMIDPHKLMGDARTSSHAATRRHESERDIDR